MNFATMCIFVGGSFLGWLIGALFKEAPDKLAKDRENVLLASLVEVRKAFVNEVGIGDEDAVPQEYQDMMARADFATRYSKEGNEPVARHFRESR